MIRSNLKLKTSYSNLFKTRVERNEKTTIGDIFVFTNISGPEVVDVKRIKFQPDGVIGWYSPFTCSLVTLTIGFDVVLKTIVSNSKHF